MRYAKGMKTLPLLALGLLAFGCAPKTEDATSNTPAPTPTAANEGGVAPMASGAAGGMTPVSGAESVDGAGGGGVGSAAKEMARRAAGTPTAPAVPNDAD